MLLGTILLALLPLGTTGANLRSSQCDESFPLAPPPRHPGARGTSHGRRLEGSLVAIPPADDSGEYYETGHYYAPLCPDGLHIDVRKLKTCINGQCLDEEIGHCTYVCTWDAPSPPPTSVPTSKPTVPPEDTEHPILMDLGRLPPKYRMNEEVRASIIRYMHDKLKYELEELGLGLELLELSYPGRLPGRPHALPLVVKMRGPSDISDFALSYIMQTMRDANQEIVNNLHRLDGSTGGDESNGGSMANEFSEAFRDVELKFETYDFNMIQTGATATPSKSPTPAPVPVVKPKTNVVVKEVEEEVKTIPWWVWLIVVLVILCLCISCCCYCRRRRRNREGDKTDSTHVNIIMQNAIPKKYRRKPKPSEQSVAASKRTRKSEHPSRSVVGHRASDQSRRTMRTRTGSFRTKRTQRTQRTHKTRSSRHPAPTPTIEFARNHSDPDLSTIHDIKTLPPLAYDAETAVSALPAGGDPPEENAMVMYNPIHNPQARDPTFYTDRTIHPDQVEPEGDKVCKKQSMFATGALISEVHRDRERDQEARRERAAKKARSKRRNSMGKTMKQSFKWHNMNTQDTDIEDPIEDGVAGDDQGYYHSERIMSEPEGLTSDEMKVKKKKNKSKKKKKRSESSKVQRRPSMGERLKASFRLRQREIPADIELEPNDSDYDSPSILTNHNPCGGDEELPPVVNNPYSRNDDTHGGEGNDSHSSAHSHSGSSKKKKAHQASSGKKKSMFGDIRRKSVDFQRDGISSADESFHVELEEEEKHNNAGGRHHEQRQESYGSYSSEASA